MHALNPHHIPHTRLRNTIAAVLLVHVALLWVTQSQLAEWPVSDESGHVVMAEVVSDMPNPASTQSVTKTNTSALDPNSSTAQDSAAASTAAAPATASGQTGSPSLAEPSADADYLKNPAPSYPRISRRNGEQGTVIVRVFISTQGTADKAEVRTSSGFARLDQAALEAVQRWRFVPGRRHGTPEAMWFNIPVRFVLE